MHYNTHKEARAMCTAATYQTKDFYFGRNLDYEFPYGEEVCIVPRNFPVPLRHLPELTQHYAIIGMWRRITLCFTTQ